MSLNELWAQLKGKTFIARNTHDGDLYVVTTKTPQGEYVGFNQTTGFAVVLRDGVAPDWMLFATGVVPVK